MMAPQRYKIHVPQEKLDRLKQKIEHATFPDEVEGIGSNQGPPLADIKRLTEAWKTFDWRAAEDKLNEHENFITPIEVDGFGTLDIHFIHKRSEDPDAIPLLFIHGWPGSFLEVLKIKSLLFPQTSTSPTSTPKPPTFHLIAPSLPNFGFSTAAQTANFGLAQYAETLHKLMLALSYPRYATQSGDWGFWIARSIGHTYPTSCIASHYNMYLAQPPKLLSQPALYLRNLLTPQSKAEKAAAERTAWFRRWSQGYNKLQSSRPQTLGYGLADSPVALLAWVWEKMRDWSDGFEWTDEEVLTWVGVYWLGVAGPAAPQRIYWEVTKEVDERYTYEGMMRWMKDIKIGVAHNPKELEIMPQLWAKTLGNVVYEVQNESGGHFYAHERPEWLVRDLHNMFGKEINAFGKDWK